MWEESKPIERAIENKDMGSQASGYFNRGALEVNQGVVVVKRGETTASGASR